jgi:glucokinase
MNRNIEASVLQAKLGIARVELINDFKAIGIALPALATKEKIPLTKLSPLTNGVIACLGPGTGLGECFLTWNPSTNVYDVWPV